MKNSVKDHLNVKAVSNLSGVSSHTLRAWERRYKAVVPARLDNGRRVYNLQDVSRLKLLKELVSRGHAISNVAQLPEETLKELTRQKTDAAVVTADPELLSENAHENSLIQDSVRVLFEALNKYKFDILSEELQRARYLFSVRTFIFKIVCPLLQDVGQKVVSGQMNISQEHAFSAILRDNLGPILTALNNRAGGSMNVALATPEGDGHEFGILISAILCATHGLQVKYLGPNLPASDLAKAALKLKTPLLILGSTPLPNDKDSTNLKSYFKILFNELPSDIELWIGGRDVPDLSDLNAKCETKFIESLPKLDQYLYGIGTSPVTPYL